MPISAVQSEESSLSLKDAQSLALNRNRDVQRANLEVKRSEAALKAVISTRYPQILAFAFEGGQLNRPNVDNLAVLPGVFQPLTQQYRIGMQVHQASLAVQVARQELRLVKQTTVAEVKKDYLAMVALQSAIRSREQDLTFLQNLASYVEAEVKRGSVLKADLLMVQARVAKAEYELDRDKDQFITIGQTLNRLLDRPPKTAVPVKEESFTMEPDIQSEAAITQALTRRPELTEVKLNVQRFDLGQKIERSRYIPDISFGATGIFSHGFDVTFPRNFIALGFLGIWEPWDWGRRLELGKVAEKQKLQSQIQLSDLSDKVSIDVDNARRAIKVVEKEVTAGALGEVSANENMRIVSRRYKVGAAVLKDVMEAQAAYSEAIAENVKAKTDYVDAQVEFDRAIGKDFD